MNGPAGDFKAADWFAQARSGAADPATEPYWLQWIDEDRNQRSYENCELAWELSADLRNTPTVAALLASTDSLVAQRRAARAAAAQPKWRVPVWQVSVAAAAIALGVFSWLFITRPSTTDYTTLVGEQRTVVLADGSSVVLNTDSLMRVEFSRNLRHIELVRGEALFSVRHDRGRPFAVHALEGVTTAVGTQFDVEIIRGAAAVSVLEGTVMVGSSGAPASMPAVAVSAGSGVGYTEAGAVSDLRPAELNRIQGWRTQRMVFNDIPLESALTEYNRYTHTPIVLSNPALGARHINGVFHIGDEAAFLSAMEQGLHLKATHGEAQTVLQPESGYEP